MVGAGITTLVLASLGGAANGSPVLIGQNNTGTSQTSVTASITSPVLRVVNNGSSAALRGDATSGIGVNGIATTGTGQQGQSQSGIGLLGIHSDTSGAAAGVEGRTNSTNTGSAGVLGRNTGGGPGLRAIVNAGAPPLTVNSDVKVSSLNSDLLDGIDSSGFWKLNGNAGTNPGTDFLGTTDNKALELKVNGQRALRLEPTTTTPNLIGGSSSNSPYTTGVEGATIGGGGSVSSPNTVSSFATVGGGEGNGARNTDASVGGGHSNIAGGVASTIAGGLGNQAGGAEAAILGGEVNTASGDHATAVGGKGIHAIGNMSFAGGGQANTAGGFYAATIGGTGNQAGGNWSFVAGDGNTVYGTDSTAVGGHLNTVSGHHSAAVGGENNAADGNYSFAAGNQAKATSDGSFVWGDETFTDIAAPAPNTFTVRASGGIWLGTTSSPSIAAGHFIDTSTGAYLSSAGAWTDNSSRALKHDFRGLNRQDVLDKVARMPISSWSYKAEKPSVRHVGPTAQDFYRAFGLGLDDKHISTIDEGGVALAAIQGLYRQNQTLERRNRMLTRRLAAQDARLTRLEGAVRKLSR